MSPPPNWPMQDELASRARFWLVHCVAEVDDQVELRRLLHRHVGGLGPFEELVHVGGSALEEAGTARPIAGVCIVSHDGVLYTTMPSSTSGLFA